jgi:thioredoxin reductase (NADPH)
MGRRGARTGDGLAYVERLQNLLTEVVARDRTGGEEYRWHPAAAFVFIGLTPNSGWLAGLVERDEWGFVRARATKQFGAAVGDGIAALIAIRSYLQRHSDLRVLDVNA